MARGRYGLAELVDALVEARRGRSKRYFALASALGVHPNQAVALLEGTWDQDDDGYAWLLDRVVAKLEVELSPFAGLMEAPPGVVRLYQHHGESVSKATSRARSAVREVGANALVFLLQLPRDVRVRGEEAAELDKYFREPQPEDW